jgi:hypothetical protein
MKKTRKSISRKSSFEPDVIEKDLYKLFPKEWLRNEAKETGLISHRLRNMMCSLCTVIQALFICNVFEISLNRTRMTRIKRIHTDTIEWVTPN